MPVLSELADYIDAQLIGDGSVQIKALASIESASTGHLSYIVSDKYLKQLKKTQASAVIINDKCLSVCPTNALVVDNVHLAFAKISHLFKPMASYSPGVDLSKTIRHAKIAPGCVVGNNVTLGKNCIIRANTVIEDNVVIGDNVLIYPNVSILQGCSIGNNVVIASGVVIGSEGFGNAKDEQNHWHSIVHLGNVVIGNDITIGANTTIDRGTLENTQIHNGVRLDNLIHIAHNVIIGEDTAIAANTGIAGSTVVGKRCMIGGMVGIIDHLNICDDVTINAKSTVDKDIKVPGIYTGIMPLMPHKQWQNVGLWLVKLDKIAKHLNLKLKNLKGK